MNAMINDIIMQYRNITKAIYYLKCLHFHQMHEHLFNRRPNSQLFQESCSIWFRIFYSILPEQVYKFLRKNNTLHTFLPTFRFIAPQNALPSFLWRAFESTYVIYRVDNGYQYKYLSKMMHRQT
jgi:hypothetical protein